MTTPFNLIIKDNNKETIGFRNVISYTFPCSQHFQFVFNDTKNIKIGEESELPEEMSKSRIYFGNIYNGI